MSAHLIADMDFADFADAADESGTYAERLGEDVYAEFKRVFVDVVEQQRRDFDRAGHESSEAAGTSLE